MDMLGGIPSPLKHMNVNWDDYTQYMEKQKKFQSTNQLLYRDISYGPKQGLVELDVLD